jgi:hypothetical protein
MRTWVLFGLLILGLYDMAYIIQWAMRSPQPPFGDFFGFWSFGRFGKDFGGLIYDPVALAAYQHKLDPTVAGSFPFPYPPTFLLAVIPLGLLPLPVAYLAWISTTFAACLLATLGRTWRSIYGLGLLVAPTTVLTITSGQNGLLSAALLVGGLNSLKTTPLLAGVLFGLLTYKPQFVCLLPVILLACRNVVAMVAFVCTAYQHLLHANQSRLDHFMPTILAGIHMLGVPAVAGYVLQITVACVVAALCWRVLCQGITDRAIAMSIIGSLLAAPYAMVYDTPMIASAVVLYWRARIRDGHAIGIWEVTLVIATFACFLDMVSASLPLLAPLLIFTIFIVIATSSDTKTSPRSQKRPPQVELEA